MLYFRLNSNIKVFDLLSSTYNQKWTKLIIEQREHEECHIIVLLYTAISKSSPNRRTKRTVFLNKSRSGYNVVTYM